MRMRARVAALLAAGAILFVVAGAASADTSGGCGGTDCTTGNGQIDFQASDGTPVQATVSFFIDYDAGTMSGDIGYSGFVDCQVDGGNPDEILINGDVNGNATVTVSGNLAKLVASGTFTGTERIQNGCTGSDVTTPLTFKVSAKLNATGLGSKSHSRTVTHNPDGTKTIDVFDDHQRPADGTVKINKMSYVLASGLIDHFTFSSTTK